jgi:acyl-CoA dehydrogenase family protein 9
LVQKGFLEELYLGEFNQERFDSFTTRETDPKTESILQRYHGLIKDYPPDLLEKEGVLPDTLRQGLSEIGIFGLSIPEAYGGQGRSLTQYLKVVEVMSSKDLALAIIPIAHLSIGIKGILLFGNEEQKRKYLTRAASGEMIFAYCLTEPKFGSDAQNIETKAVLSEDGSHYILNGHKTYITNGNYAGGLTVFAQMDPENPGFMGAFIVETGWDGVKVGKDMPKMGLKISSTTFISFKDVCVPAENLLGKPGDGFKVAMTILNYGRLGLGAASVGVMKQSLEEMKERASTRKQFGVPIREFELIQEKIVRTRVRALAASSMTAFTARLLEKDPTVKVAIESSHCKLYGTDRAWDTLYDALQVAGGSGYISTQPYEKRMRDFRVNTVFEGTSEIHSIYPPLYLSRKIRNEIKARGRNPITKLLFLIKAMLRRQEWPLKFDNRIMKKASRLARRNARHIRVMLNLGLLVHGKKMMGKEFFLRRITHLSLDLFAILSILARLKAEKERRQDVRQDLKVLAYFLEEAKVYRRVNRRFFKNRKEILHKSLFRDISSSSGNSK